MRARLESLYFGPAGGQYPRLARVLSLTARRFCPDWDVTVRRIPPHHIQAASGSDADAANHYKLAEWTRLACVAPDGSRLLLVDADTFVAAPLDPLWERDFDVAYTARPQGSRFPLNAGVVALRVGPRAREFMLAWLGTDAAFLADTTARGPWRRTHGGQNQASLGFVLGAASVKVLALPCAEWNCEDTTWAKFGPGTRIVHVKSALRMCAFGIGPSAPGVRNLARMWRDLDAEAATL